MLTVLLRVLACGRAVRQTTHRLAMLYDVQRRALA